MTSAPEYSVARRVGSAAGGAALIGLSGWLALINLRRPNTDGLIFWVPVACALLTMGLLCAWSVLGDDLPSSRMRIRGSWRAGWRVGAVGLALGFIGPLVLYPKASLGPLLGLLLTGPAGFVLGALVGAAIRPKADT